MLFRNDLRQTGKLQSLQLLRAIAVLFVVVSHCAHELVSLLSGRALNFNEKLFPGDFGVDLFFVISGFIMVYSCWDQFGRRGAPLKYFTRRLIRIVPLYWAATTLMIAVILLSPGTVKTATNEIGQWITSYLFLPYQREGDGMIRPVLGLGWSLQYEMLFYFMFAVSLFFSRTRAVAGLLAALVALVFGASLLRSFSGGQSGALVTFLSHPIILEFGLGAGIGFAYCRGSRIPKLLGLLLVIFSGVFLMQMPGFDMTVDSARAVLYGIPASLIVIAAVLPEGDDQARLARPILEMGEISYATYLVHPFVVGGVSMLFRKSGLYDAMDPAGLVVGYTMSVVALSIIISYLVHYLFDLPVTGYLRRISGALYGSRAQPA